MDTLRYTQKIPPFIRIVSVAILGVESSSEVDGIGLGE
jgi:hypothetical protein